MIPGSNLLKTALTVIAPQTVAYYQTTGRSVNDIGEYVTAYAAPVNINGSFQAVPRSVYEQYGLDFQKNYSIFYTNSNLIDVQRNVSPDKIVFNSKDYICESANADWFSVDGWKGILCVLVN